MKTVGYPGRSQAEKNPVTYDSVCYAVAGRKAVAAETVRRFQK
jgi:hypothetical protein